MTLNFINTNIMDPKSINTVFEERYKYLFGFDLKNKQLDVISEVLNGKSVVGIFPTGFGKSICYMMLPLLTEKLCLVISPLKSLIIDQVNKANKVGIKAAAIMTKDEMDEETIGGIKDGNFSLVYLSPEMLLDTEWNNILLKSDIYQERVCAVVIDEVHLLDTWGEKFSPTFSRLGEIRSHLTHVPFLLLTATITRDILDNILKKLHLEMPIIVAISPDRPNIKLIYKSESGMDPIIELSWYLNKLKEIGRDTPKAILYARSVSLVGKLYCHIVGALREQAYHGTKRSHENRIVTVFHAGLDQSDQKNILENFMRGDSIIRLVICTVAFGLGVDVPDVRYVLHWGISESILEYWQEVGRAGRDGLPSTALMYATKTSIVHANSDMKNVCRGIKLGEILCYRQDILNFLIPQKQNSGVSRCNLNCETCKCGLCTCCNICAGRCPCSK